MNLFEFKKAYSLKKSNIFGSTNQIITDLLCKLKLMLQQNTIQQTTKTGYIQPLLFKFETKQNVPQ